MNFKLKFVRNHIFRHYRRTFPAKDGKFDFLTSSGLRTRWTTVSGKTTNSRVPVYSKLQSVARRENWNQS